MTKRLSKISANALYANAATSTGSSSVNPNDLGLSIFNNGIFQAANGWITLNPDSSSWAPGVNLVSTTANTTVTGNVTFSNDIQVLQRGTDANSALRLSDLSAIGGDLLITTIGSLDLQFTIQNLYTNSVDQSGTPSYISNFSNSSWPTARLSGGDYYSGLGPQTGAPYILGNASTLGTNYTVVNTQMDTQLKPATVYDWGGGNYYTYHTKGTVTMVLDIALACGLENNQYLGSGAVNPKWKGNYKFDAFSSLFKMREARFWDYVGASDTMEYSVNMIPQTLTYTDSNYGKYNVSCVMYASASYHAANLGARWMGIATKIRNLIIL
jgi:hypothetical protein